MTRQHDLETLRNDYKTASPDKRKLIETAANKIRHEDSKIKSMRESLLMEHRKGNIGNIKDIHSYVNSHRGYKNE